MTIANNYVMDGTGAWVPMAGSVGGSVSVPSAIPGAVTLTDASIASATGASQTIVAASSSRQTLIVSNPSAGVTWWINPSGGTAAPNAAGSFALAPGARWEPKPPPANAVTGIATAATALTVKTGDAAGTFFNVGTLGAQNANAVAITGGTIAGLTSLGVAGPVTIAGNTNGTFTSDAVSNTNTGTATAVSRSMTIGGTNRTFIQELRNNTGNPVLWEQVGAGINASFRICAIHQFFDAALGLIATLSTTGLSIGAGKTLQLGNAFAVGAIVPTGSLVITDSAGVAYKVAAVPV